MKFTIPFGTKTVYRKHKRNMYDPWLQIQHEELSDKVKHLIIAEVEKHRRKGKLIPVVMLHKVVDTVEPHTDDISKSCYVLPVIVNGGWVFRCEQRNVKLEEGQMFKFSTFDRHSLVKRSAGECVFYTVDYVPRNSL